MEKFSVPLVVAPFFYPSRFCFSRPPRFLHTAAALYLNGQSTTIIVARQGLFSITFFAFWHSSLCSFVFRRCSTFLFILYIASSYCLSFSSNIVDYIVFLPRTTRTRTQWHSLLPLIHEREAGDVHWLTSWACSDRFITRIFSPRMLEARVQILARREIS